jgi:hypothetical protein
MTSTDDGAYRLPADPTKPDSKRACENIHLVLKGRHGQQRTDRAADGIVKGQLGSQFRLRTDTTGLLRAYTIFQLGVKRSWVRVPPARP